MELTRKLFQADIKDVDDAEGTIVSVISSKAIDRDGDVVLPKGALLDNYRNNPVVLWSHGMGGSENRPIGKNLWIKRQGNELRAKTQFDMKDEFARSIFNKFKGGFLKSWSIGFIPTKSHAPDEKDLRKDPEMASARQIITEWELLEYSAVAVPSNPEARTLDVKSVNEYGEYDEETGQYLELADETWSEDGVDALDSLGTYDPETRTYVMEAKKVIPEEELVVPEGNEPEEPREIEVIKEYIREVKQVREVKFVGHKRSVQLIREPLEKTVSDAVKRLKGRMV